MPNCQYIIHSCLTFLYLHDPKIPTTLDKSQIHILPDQIYRSHMWLIFEHPGGLSAGNSKL